MAKCRADCELSVDLSRFSQISGMSFSREGESASAASVSCSPLPSVAPKGPTWQSSERVRVSEPLRAKQIYSELSDETLGRTKGTQSNTCKTPKGTK